MSFAFTPPDGYRNLISFPTSPASEADFRDSMQSLLDQIRDELNSGASSAIGIHSILRQALINPGFAVNQRAVSGAVTLAAGAYGHDRWKAGAAGCTYTFATVNNVTTITITAGSLVQVIEGNNLYSGTYTLSWTGTAQGKIGAGAYGTTGITGAATGGTNLSIEFNAGTLSDVQLNFGSTSLPFQPRSFAEELVLCQRYYEKSYDLGTTPATASQIRGLETFYVGTSVANNAVYGKVRYKVKKRNFPTVTIYPYTTPTNTGRASDSGGTDLGAGSGSTTFSGEDGFTVTNTSGGTLTPLSGSVVFHYTADAEL